MTCIPSCAPWFLSVHIVFAQNRYGRVQCKILYTGVMDSFKPPLQVGKQQQPQGTKMSFCLLPAYANDES